MSFTEHRQRLYETIPVNSLIVSYAGIPLHANEDDYCAFEVNSQYFWLTGIEREGTAFIAFKSEEKVFETLFIEEPDGGFDRVILILISDLVEVSERHSAEEYDGRILIG